MLWRLGQPNEPAEKLLTEVPITEVIAGPSRY